MTKEKKPKKTEAEKVAARAYKAASKVKSLYPDTLAGDIQRLRSENASTPLPFMPADFKQSKLDELRHAEAVQASRKAKKLKF